MQNESDGTIVSRQDGEVESQSGTGMDSVSDLADNLLKAARSDLPEDRMIQIPLSELSSLGAGISSLIPGLRTVTQKVTFDTNGLYRVANAGAGDTLKAAKDGNFWGALRTAEGKSKMGKLASVDSLSAEATTVMPFNPATLMMAAAFLAIEKKLDVIEKMEKEILSFLEIEKQSGIEADVETLMNLLRRYRLNWDNELFIESNHKLVIDLQRTALSNMISYEKKSGTS